MPTAISFGYSPDALTYDSKSGNFQLDPKYDHREDRVRFEFSDDDNYLDGDRSKDEVGDDETQVASVTTPSGEGIAKGHVYAEQFGVLRAPDGTMVWIDRIEIDGVNMGYIPSQPLDPGVKYEFLFANDIDKGNKEEDRPDNRMTYKQYAESSVPCFAGGTMIRTPDGDHPVDWLMPGDRVITRDRGVQRIRWAGRFRPEPTPDANRETDPIHIPAGAIAPGQPEKALRVSPQHHIQIENPLADLLFATPIVHVAAGHMVGWNGITQSRPGPRFRYHHILFTRPEVVMANGAWAESLYLGERADDLMGPDQMAEIDALDLDPRDHARPARRRMRKWEALILLAPSLHEHVTTHMRRYRMV